MKVVSPFFEFLCGFVGVFIVSCQIVLTRHNGARIEISDLGVEKLFFTFYCFMTINLEMNPKPLSVRILDRTSSVDLDLTR